MYFFSGPGGDVRQRRQTNSLDEYNDVCCFILFTISWRVQVLYRQYKLHTIQCRLLISCCCYTQIPERDHTIAVLRYCIHTSSPDDTCGFAPFTIPDYDCFEEDYGAFCGVICDLEDAIFPQVCCCKKEDFCVSNCIYLSGHNLKLLNTNIALRKIKAMHM